MSERLVLFDLDDTLFDHMGSVVRGLEAVGRHFPPLARRPAREAAVLYQRLLESVHPAIVRGRISPDAARLRRFQALLRWAGAPASTARAREASRIYREEYQRARRVVPGSVGVLRALRPQARIAILSNNRREEQAEKLDSLGLARWVDLLVTSEELPWAKPDPRAFRYAVREAGSRPHLATMVGDSWAVDIAGARRAGLGAVWVNRSGAPLPAGEGVETVSGLRPVARAVEAILRARPPRARGANAY